MGELICYICIYQPETDKFIGIILENITFIGMRMFPTVHHREFPSVQGDTLTITLGFFISFYQYFLNITLVFTLIYTCIHIHAYSYTYTNTHTQTSLKVLFSSLNFCV